MINKKEVERYLGYGKNIPDERNRTDRGMYPTDRKNSTAPVDIQDLRFKIKRRSDRSGGNEDAEQKSGKKLKRL